ncbi:MAG TPA: pantetheine-phosphate adenylyltransferase [Actinomycetota bacterium]|nr:pantetheine-phosphate adenylyltransferase [Actinomycetota bacterium]
MTTALCPGSFDPPTNGHVDVIERAARHFDTVVAAVIVNPSKHALFDADERTRLLTEVLGHLDNVEVASFDGLLVDFARDRGVNVVVKGLRAVSDYEYELQMAQMNAALSPGLDTLFVSAKPEWAFLSSSLVREVARYGGSVEGLVPAPVAAALKERFGA